MTGRVDALASDARFARHAAPVLAAIPADMRGVLGASVHEVNGAPGPLLVADAARDLPEALATGRPVVLMEHGVGQTYDGQRLGGDGRRAEVALHLAPGPFAARWFRARFPAVPCVEVGCPALDPWHRAGERTRHDPPVVAVSFRFHCRSDWPETLSALATFATALAPLAGRWRVLGHGHPRALPRLARLYEAVGISVVRDFEVVLGLADLYVADNTSTLYEFASTGRPVVALNAADYRRDVEHGLRFWSAIPGLAVDTPGDLPAAVERGLADPSDLAERRQWAVAEAYVACDGQAAQRAAEAILALARDAPGRARGPVATG